MRVTKQGNMHKLGSMLGTTTTGLLDNKDKAKKAPELKKTRTNSDTKGEGNAKSKTKTVYIDINKTKANTEGTTKANTEGTAKTKGTTNVKGTANVQGTAKAEGTADVKGTAKAKGTAKTKGTTQAEGTGKSTTKPESIAICKTKTNPTNPPKNPMRSNELLEAISIDKTKGACITQHTARYHEGAMLRTNRAYPNKKGTERITTTKRLYAKGPLLNPVILLKKFDHDPRQVVDSSHAQDNPR